MAVVGDLLGRDRRTRTTALVTPNGSERTYHDLITNAYKAANVLRYLGAREGSTVAVDPQPGFHTTVAFLGAARLGAAVRFDPHAGIAAGDRVVVAPVADESDFDPDPGTNLTVFGGAPDRPETTHWEGELWSENPGTPPSEVDPADIVIRGGDGDVSHRTLLALATGIADDYGMTEGTGVVLRVSFAEPHAVAAGVIAPLSCGATVVLDRSSGRENGDIGVVRDSNRNVPEPRRVDLATL
ncbi:acyl-CoA synthetase (AMP-forming)/AMP-acid ligase II [Halorubrum alkaliphilum]|uniref:Acyl-CoA synthetase (AMP-forming)/AMP-acid ligase II n=1 Tax=Halorubrum alkaliphilum TaxID=261290 RepID=A0A8T4GD04_9EURY|nr:hypothetical protein [Halorubrum alkaliphilum]MBP1921993.1 acyl-CoA synthetase (AMP-forming)/AMP-acid ligase II [Halorubrum alkaliphilum]